MWIFTTFGFFSAVEHRDDNRSLLVRTRVRVDAELLAVKLYGSDAIMVTPNADYPYRVKVGKREFAQLISEEIMRIGYKNFKNEVASKQSYARARLYGNVWGQMHDAERKLDCDREAIG